MRGWVTTCGAVLLASAVVQADLTLKQTVTVEGGPAAMMGGGLAPKIVMRIKGNRSRVETEVMGHSTIIIGDLDTKQMFTLNEAEKTARVLGSSSPLVPPGTTAPDMNVSFKPTGQKKTIDNMPCDEYAIEMTMSMPANPQMPPEAAQMLQDVRMVMTGSSWVATSGPGVTEFAAYQKAAAAANMTAAVAAAMGGTQNGLDRIMAASAAARGMPYVTEMTMSFEGTGQLVDMMKQMGAMKIVNRIESVSTDSLSDDLFKIPAGYTIVK